ncbi:sulfatase [Maribellus mangrovi]|uniref:sulfatase n=1 Tax=Maribellus mangrovi TaxID=3133146 RepID=UPI0030EF1F9D
MNFKNLLISIVLFFNITQAFSEKKLNVLFIITDDLTTTAVSAYENKASFTPNIDKLASEGVLYTSAYCQFPVCGPSRASLMFGYYPHATGTFGYTSGRENVGEHKSWSQFFMENGYKSMRVSKIFHMGVPKDITMGSNGSDDSLSWHERYNVKGLEYLSPGEGELVQNNPDGTKPVKDGNVMTIVKSEGGDQAQPDGKAAEKAIQLIKANKNKPFFLAVGFVRPHVPFVAPKEYFQPYPWQRMAFPVAYNDDWADMPKRAINYVNSVKAKMNPTQEKKAIAAYYASVAYMDAQVGKVLNALKEEGLEDNTIVIFTSDHGFHLAEHRFWMKVSLKEESVRVPLIIKVPGKEPAVCNSFVELIDLYPTIAELAGLKPSEHLQGKSLVETINNPQTEVRDYIFTVTQGGNSFLLRNRDWAFMSYNEDGSLGYELYDMRKDPYQINNLAQKPEYKEVLNHFKELLSLKLEAVRKNDL